MRNPNSKRKLANESTTFSDISIKQKRLNYNINSTINSSTSFFDDSSTLPEALAAKLDSFAVDLVRNEDLKCPDLVDFDIENFDSVEDIKELREQISRTQKHFDVDGMTDVNYETAAIAGAKIYVDERPATRNMTKKLADEVGCSEGSLLYRGLPSDVSESKAAKEMAQKRKEDIVESFVDFHKQLKFKKNILDHVVKKSDGYVIQTRRKSAKELRTPPKRRLCRKAITDLQKTPKKLNFLPNPLDYNRIMDNYADILASEVKERSDSKRISPIPFNIDEDEEMPQL